MVDSQLKENQFCYSKCQIYSHLFVLLSRNMCALRQHTKFVSEQLPL